MLEYRVPSSYSSVILMDRYSCFADVNIPMVPLDDSISFTPDGLGPFLRKICEAFQRSAVVGITIECGLEDDNLVTLLNELHGVTDGCVVSMDAYGRKKNDGCCQPNNKKEDFDPSWLDLLEQVNGGVIVHASSSCRQGHWGVVNGLAA